ncbi:GNAT family N-acetyltransferase [Tessaracoccus palaemonis]|uniref:GNAT family N-acetyltransferase n=1 Tax=Tessaracoccus palaemonis TaxID=2829499 RepID=A0ABX8SLN3_9ACTN|nr:GNAT family N-acetyltransferase [Tessaracoccus palaemonis]QXT63799.1 GNAT family N-acetyltransferase [Tessaracoccus palaemonis]
MLDPEMMSYNAGWSVRYAGYDPASGCLDWPEEDWPAFEQKLARPAAEQGYFYVLDDETDEFVGHVHYEVDGDGEAHIGVNVIPRRRGAGLGSHFMSLLLDRVRRDTDATVIVNDFEDDRMAAARLHRRSGFVPDDKTSNAFGRPTRAWRISAPDPFRRA